MKKIILSLLILSFLGAGLPLLASDQKTIKKSNPLVWFSKKGIRFFMNFLSKYDGPRCPHSPTCSLYTFKAIDHYGFIKGWTMGSARRLRGSPYTIQWNLPMKGNRLLDTIETTSLWNEKERRKITSLSP